MTLKVTQDRDGNGSTGHESKTHNYFSGQRKRLGVISVINYAWLLAKQILSAESSFYIYDRPLTEINVMASFCKIKQSKVKLFVESANFSYSMCIWRRLQVTPLEYYQKHYASESYSRLATMLR